MEPNSIYIINGSHMADTNSNWKWKGISFHKKRNRGKQFPVDEFFRDNRRKGEEALLGPGYGAGIGCGVGVGFGLVGGLGFGGSPWNHLQMVFGFGLGCGVGFGFGYGQGIGYGNSLDYLRSRFSRNNPNSKNRIVIEI